MIFTSTYESVQYVKCFCLFYLIFLCLCVHSVAHITVSVSNEPTHVEAEGEEAGPQQVTQGSKVGDGEVVWVHSSTPHPVNHPVCQVEEDHHLEEEANIFDPNTIVRRYSESNSNSLTSLLR